MTHDTKIQHPAQPILMPFRKHKGVPLDQLDDDYMLWLSCLPDLRQPLLGHVLREMGRRLAARPATQVQP